MVKEKRRGDVAGIHQLTSPSSAGIHQPTLIHIYSGLNKCYEFNHNQTGI
jgi:hypothetical protein